MSVRHPTIGGNTTKAGVYSEGKSASDKPPRQKKVIPEVPKMVCACGAKHDLHLTEDTLQIIIPCQCGAILRYYAGSCTIEEVDGI